MIALTKGRQRMDDFQNTSVKRRLIPGSPWADLALLGVAIAWGASYPVAKGVLLHVPVLVLIFYRFFITTAIMAVVARKEIASGSTHDYVSGLSLGAILSAIFLAETYGLASTTATNAALIISLCMIFTPLLEYGVARHLPPFEILLSAAVACVGVGILTGGISHINFGDALILGAAVLRAIMVVSTKRLTQGRTISSALLTAMQGSVVMVVALILATAQFSAAALLPPCDLSFWKALLFLSVFCTIAAFFIQNAAVRRTSPTRVSFLMGTEPLFGLVFAHLLLAEPVTPVRLVGASLILMGTFLGITFENRIRT